MRLKLFAAVAAALAFAAAPALAQNASVRSVAPTYANGDSRPLSMTTSAELRVTSGASTAAASGDNVPASTAATASRSMLYGFDGVGWDRLAAVPFGPNAAQAVVGVPTSASGAALVAISRTDAGSNLQAKTSGGSLYSWSVTSGATAGYLLIYNRATIPPEGVTGANALVDCIAVPANSTVRSGVAPMPELFSAGIWLNFSSTGCFVQTSSETAFIRAQVQ